MNQIEIINEEHLKNILENLTPENIVEHAYNNWIPSQKTGHTILDLEKGEIYGIAIDLNEISILENTHLKLFTIESYEQAITPEELFTIEEHEKYLDFKEDEPSEYTPDIVTDFCCKNEINEKKRNIKVLARKFKEKEMLNYNMWESKILNEYYNLIL